MVEFFLVALMILLSSSIEGLMRLREEQLSSPFFYFTGSRQRE
ncbi:hypothetical protein J5U22_01512 [Saccharolobus shibatae]|uniref:Uncharacterized protein n=1 Tax=Saccharolobus shibatae TaxID=2286 RepID=A0A8F5GZB6_9CREN|nr:hypothetical protein J5U22_01512 [Saccharolobus shibatae]